MLTSNEVFNLEIEINVGTYVTISAKYITASGTDDDIQFLGGGAAAYLLNTFRPKFKADLVIDFQLYTNNPISFYSGVAYRL